MSLKNCRLSYVIYVFFAFSLTSCGAGQEKLFSEYLSPDNNHMLIVKVAESRMPQGPSYVTIYQKKKHDSQSEQIFTSKLENDGVPFTDQNISVRWVSEKIALICLRATDLPDHGLFIEIKQSVSVRPLEEC
jgi:hypothetical protein